MTIAELTRRVAKRLQSRNEGRDITALALPIVAATVSELEKSGYLALGDNTNRGDRSG